ncbi:MAG TPA: hypothetical protein VD998_02350 [Verrucomicrobiae bacterium]|nr:hypothetical protein [Verrucomicrobiae bacterium]
MTNNGPVYLLSKDDWRSFLIPAYAFRDKPVNEVAQYVQTHGFAPVESFRDIFVPRVTPGYHFSTMALSDSYVKNRYDVIRRRTDPKPASATNVCLMAEGPRQFNVYGRGSVRDNWTTALNESSFDCFALWSKQNGAPLSEVQHYDLATHDRQNLLFGRSGRGVLYASKQLIDRDGKLLDEYRIYLFMIDFHIMDRDVTRDDVLIVKVMQRTTLSNQPYPNVLDAAGSDRVWEDLIRGAQNAFQYHCKPIPDEIEEHRAFMVRQTMGLRTVRNDFRSEWSSEALRRIGWQEALKRVKEAWQLHCVAETFYGLGEFSSDGGIYTIPYETVPTMIQRHECDEERRAELMGMVDKFVRPMFGARWNYRGD